MDRRDKPKDLKWRPGLEFKSSEPKSKNAIMVISGYASTNDVDAYNEIVEPTAFAETMADFMKFPMLLFGHDWYSKPIGKITKWELDERGLWIEAEIADTAEGNDVKKLIEFGILKAFSIGFSTLERSEPDDDGGAAVIRKLRLYEISVVNIPANETALLDSIEHSGLALKSLSLDELTNPVEHKPSDGGDNHSTRRESNHMGAIDQDALEKIKNAEKMVGEHKTALETVSGELAKQKELAEENARLVKTLQSKLDEYKTNIWTPAEQKTFAEKIGVDLAEVQKSLQKVQAGRNIQKAQMPFTEFLVKQHGRMVPKHDDGRSFEPLEAKAYLLLQAPVKYDDSEQARNLKLLRDLADTVVIVNAYMRGLQRQGTLTSPYRGPQSLKSYKMFRDMLDIVDPEFAKAMYSTATGYGDEWVPTLMGANLYDYYRLNTVVENYIEHFNMPSNPYDWPIKSGVLSSYLASEAAVDNPDELTKTRLATSKVTFTTGTHAVAVPVSPELIEDSVINIAQEIGIEMMKAMATGFESAILNGDDTSTHRDTGASYTNNVSVETHEDGLRYLAVDRSATFNIQSTTATYGDASSTFTAKDVRYLRLKKMGAYGVNPRELVYVTSQDPYMQMLSWDENTMGGRYMANSTYREGEMTMFDGSPVLVSAQFAETLNSSGVNNGSSSTKGLVCFNKTAFKIGERRGYTVGYEFNQRTQQMTFVATARKSFKCMAPSTQDPVAYGINIA